MFKNEKLLEIKNSNLENFLIQILDFTLSKKLKKHQKIQNLQTH
jgi:hypothetical protein